jgi:hypothetical protein
MAHTNAQASHNGTDAEPIGEATDLAGDGSEMSADDGVVFLADLARAMHATAASEQARILEATERRRQLHIGGIHAREAAEADEIRELADEDVKGINTWADNEIKRLKLERERRITARREQLQIRLEEHRAVIAREVDGVEEAIKGYRGEIDRFFGAIESETNPVVIARQAGTQPVFPALDQIGSGDSAASGAELGTVAVAAAALDTAEGAEADQAEPPIDAEAAVATDEATDEAIEPVIEGETEAVAESEPVAETEIAAESEQPADGEQQEAEVIGVMDPDSLGQLVTGQPWDAAPESEAPVEAAEGQTEEVAVAAVAEGGEQPSEETEEAMAEAVVMPRSSGAGSWLRWPNNNNSDRFGPGR